MTKEEYSSNEAFNRFTKNVPYDSCQATGMTSPPSIGLMFLRPSEARSHAVSVNSEVMVIVGLHNPWQLAKFYIVLMEISVMELGSDMNHCHLGLAPKVEDVDGYVQIPFLDMA